MMKKSVFIMSMWAKYIQRGSKDKANNRILLQSVDHLEATDIYSKYNRKRC